MTGTVSIAVGRRRGVVSAAGAPADDAAHDVLRRRRHRVPLRRALDPGPALQRVRPSCCHLNPTDMALEYAEMLEHVETPPLADECPPSNAYYQTLLQRCSFRPTTAACP